MACETLKIEGGASREFLILFEPNFQYRHLKDGKAPIYIRIGEAIKIG